MNRDAPNHLELKGRQHFDLRLHHALPRGFDSSRTTNRYVWCASQGARTEPEHVHALADGERVGCGDALGCNLEARNREDGKVCLEGSRGFKKSELLMLQQECTREPARQKAKEQVDRNERHLVVEIVLVAEREEEFCESSQVISVYSPVIDCRAKTNQLRRAFLARQALQRGADWPPRPW